MSRRLGFLCSNTMLYLRMINVTMLEMKIFSNSSSNTFDWFHCKQVNKPPSVELIPVSWSTGSSSSSSNRSLQLQLQLSCFFSKLSLLVNTEEKFYPQNQQNSCFIECYCISIITDLAQLINSQDHRRNTLCSIQLASVTVFFFLFLYSIVKLWHLYDRERNRFRNVFSKW